MPAYATQAEFEAYVEGFVTTDPAALARLLERASHQIDRLFAPRPIIGTGTWAGFVFDPTKLAEGYRAALADATCAQAEYRRSFGTEADYASFGMGGRVKGPDFEYDAPASGFGGAARIGPKVFEELERLRPMMVTTARARP